MPKEIETRIGLASAMTVAELRRVLAGMPDDAVLTHSEYDGEWDCTYYRAVRNVTSGGGLVMTHLDKKSFRRERRHAKQERESKGTE